MQFTTLRGARIDFTYGKTPVLDGTPVDYAQWKLYEGPHLTAELGSGRISLSHVRRSRTLDFNTLTITDSVTP